MIPSILVLAVVFVLIAVRRFGRVRLPIWGVMLGGAAAVLLAGEITPVQAAAAIDVDVMLFLFGAFVVGQALETSGYLFHLSYKLFSRARSADTLMLYLLFGAGLASAFLMNDTLAIIGTPLVLLLAKQHRMKPEMLLLALAFAVTLGSVLSPIGNPQNLLIAIHGGFANPFVDFARHLALPTIVNLGITFWFLKRYYHESFHGDQLVHVREEFRDARLARLARLSLILLMALVALKIALVFAGIGHAIRLSYIALAAAAPVLLFSPRRWSILRHLDWYTLIFFAAMFVLMQAANADRRRRCVGAAGTHGERTDESADIERAAGGVVSADADARRRHASRAARTRRRQHDRRQSAHPRRRQQRHHHPERRKESRSQHQLPRIRPHRHSTDRCQRTGVLAVPDFFLIHPEKAASFLEKLRSRR